MTVEIRDRIKEFKRIPASQILPNPSNWRTHPEKQREALRALFRSIGIAAAVLVRQVGKNKYMLIDGHLRHEELEALGDKPIPALILDVTEEEADTLLATVDPLAGMAGSDGGVLRGLLAKLKPGDEAMVSLFNEVSKVYGSVKEAEDGEELPDEEGDPDAPPEPSHVRMVQMFLDTETLPPFQGWVEEVGEYHGTKTLTTTVYAAMEAYAKIVRKKQKAAAV